MCTPGAAGPEWRASLIDRERGVIEDPEDDGSRHRIWAQHTVKDRQWGYRTRVGAALDLGRLLNNLGEFTDNQVCVCVLAVGAGRVGAG